MRFTGYEAENYSVASPKATNYRAVLRKYGQYWYLFILGLLLSIGAAFIFISRSTPQYDVSASVLLKDEEKGGDASKNALFNDLGILNTSKNIDNEIILLKSVSLMQRVLTELSINASFYVKTWARDQEIYTDATPFRLIITKLDSSAYTRRVVFTLKTDNAFELRENDQATTHQFGQIIQKPYGAFTLVASPRDLLRNRNTPIIIEFHSIEQLANDYTRRLRVNPVNKQSTVLTISLVDAVPEKGQAIINKLVEVYNKEAAEDKNSVAANTIAFIDERLQRLRVELTDVEKGVEEFKQKNQVADVSSQISQSLEDASGYNKQISEAAIQIEVLESIESYINQGKAQNQLIPSALSVQDATLSGLIAKFNELQLDRERMLRTALPGNPFVQSMDEQLANLRVNILDNLKTTKNSLVITRKNLLAKSTQFSSRIQRVPTIERELLGINRQQEIKNALYLYLLQKREESALSLAATVSNSKIVDAAMVERNPISPKKPVVLVVALFLGLGLPLAGIYLKESLNNKILTIDDVEQAVTVPILGELMHHSGKSPVVVTRENRSPMAEMFRLIRSNLHFAAAGNINQVLLVTSSMSGEGKTFFCLNLAASILLTGKKVIIINLDLRKPGFMPPDQAGLTEYLTRDDISINDIVTISTLVPELCVINSGMLPANPAELTMSPKLKHLLHVLKESFDQIIIDTAPVGQVADALNLASYASSTIYLARYNFTLKSQLELLHRLHSENRFNNLMLVLNDAAANNVYGYGYGYGYKTNDINEHKKGNFTLK